MKLRFLLLSVILTAVGIGTLVLFDYGLHVDHTKWWHYFGYHLGALFASIGSVGIAFELLNRSQIGEEWIAALRHAFAEDPSIAKRLSDEARQDRVRYTLEAQLDREVGDAIFYSTVLPYMTGRRRFRVHMGFDLHLRDLDSDVTVASDSSRVVFSRDKYHLYVADYRFKREYDSGLHTVGCLLIDDYEELTTWFGRPDTLYREVVSLEEPDLSALTALLAGCDQKTIPSVLQPAFNLSVSIDGKAVKVGSASISANGKSIIFKLGIHRPLMSLLLGSSHDSRQVVYHIRLEALRAKTLRRLPLLLPEPTANPSSLFTYPPSVRNVVPAPFFGAEPPFARVVHDHKLRQIRVEMPESDRDKKWVFPPTGVIFTWDCP